MRRVTIGHSKNGYVLYLDEVKPWAVAVESVYAHLCDLTRGWLGGHGLPDVFWRIPVGRPVYDRDPQWADEKGRPMLMNSVASKLYDFETKMQSLTDLHGRRLTDNKGIPITEDVARRINPKFVAEITSFHGDD